MGQRFLRNLVEERTNSNHFWQNLNRALNLRSNSLENLHKYNNSFSRFLSRSKKFDQIFIDQFFATSLKQYDR